MASGIMILLKFSLLFLALVLVSCENENYEQLFYLTPTKNNFFFDGDTMKTEIPYTYCYTGVLKELSSLWKTVSVSLTINNDQFELFEGDSPREISQKFKEHQSSWSANIFSLWKRKHIKLEPFNTTCIGILTKKSYRISLIIEDVNYWQLLKFTSGMVLFFYAQVMSQNVIFYYLCGITVGIGCSVLVLIYLIGRLIPNKSLMYSVSISGWTLSYFFLQYLLDNAKLILLNYKQYVFGYIVASGLISFAFCYRFGPLTNPKTRNLIKWTLQFAGLALIFISSYLYEVTYMVDLLLLASRVLPISWLISGYGLVKRKLFRPKIKLISKKEFHEQGRTETRKALEELRGYCSSPECNPWKTVLRIKNPVKFAEFMEGSFHVSDDEIDAYDSLSIKPNGTIITDDSDSIAEYSEDD